MPARVGATRIGGGSKMFSQSPLLEAPLSIPPPQATAHQHSLAQLGPNPALGMSPQLPPPSPTVDARWLNLETYKAKDDIFNKYDPMAWLPTIKFQVSEFMLPPWLFTSLTCFALTVWVELYPQYKELFNAPLDAHTIMGAALSFLVVMRTDTSMTRWWDARSSWSSISNGCLSLGAHTVPMLKSDEAGERLLMEIMAFLMSLKAFLRDEKIDVSEIGERMDYHFVRKLNSSVCPPLQVRHLSPQCPPPMASSHFSWRVHPHSLRPLTRHCRHARPSSRRCGTTCQTTRAVTASDRQSLTKLPRPSAPSWTT